MKELIRQFYNEGLATTFYLKPLNFVSKHIKNEVLLKILKIMICFVYTIIVLMFALWIFLYKLSII